MGRHPTRTLGGALLGWRAAALLGLAGCTPVVDSGNSEAGSSALDREAVGDWVEQFYEFTRWDGAAGAAGSLLGGGVAAALYHRMRIAR